MSSETIAIPLRDALKLGPLSEAVVLGGSAGLDRIVTTVTVMETDDAFRFLTGNELLITALFAVRDDPSAQLHWLDELANRGCAGIILCYVGRYFKGDLEELVERANELAFPLLTIPDEQVIYSDIITAVLTELLHRQTKRLEYALSIHNRLTQEALMGASLETLIQSLSELLQSTIIMTDNKSDVIASSPFGAKGQNLLNYLLPGNSWRREIHPPELAMNTTQLLDNLQTVQKKWEEKHGFGFDIAIHPIQVEQTLDGYLLILKHGEAITHIEDYALRVGITVIALERMKAMRVQETERRLQGDFLDDLLNRSVKSPEVIKKQAMALGLDLEDKRGVMVINIDMQSITTPEQTRNTHAEQLQEEIYHLVERIVAQRSQPNITMSRGRRILVLLGTQTNQLSSTSIKEQIIDLGKYIIQEAKPYLDHHFNTYSPAEKPSGFHPLSQAPILITLSIGISNADYNYTTLHQGYADALQALEIGQRLLGLGHVMHIDDTHAYSILDFVSDRKEARQMVEIVLGPIKDYDAINNTDLLKSLEMLCLSGESSTEAARKLYIHRNTLAYRQARIKKLLRFDPFSGQGRIRMEIALMLNKLIEAAPD